MSICIVKSYSLLFNFYLTFYIVSHGFKTQQVSSVVLLSVGQIFDFDFERRLKVIRQIDHIAIAVKNLDEQMKFYADVLGLKCVGIEDVLDQKVKVAIFPVGEVRIELLEPTAENSPIAKFLEKKGEGIHHIAYLVTDLEGNLKRIEEHNVQLIDSKPRLGAMGHKIAFLHPKSTFGVLTELCEH